MTGSGPQCPEKRTQSHGGVRPDLVSPNSSGLDQPRIEHDLLANMRVELSWCHDHWVGTQLHQLLFHRWCLQGVECLAVESVDDIARCRAGCKNTDPKIVF